MKIYLPVFVAISALSFLTTAAHSMEKSPSRSIESLNRNIVSLRTSELNSATANVFSFESGEDYAIDLSANNSSFSLNMSDISRDNSIVRNENSGQTGYSARTEIVNF